MKKTIIAGLTIFHLMSVAEARGIYTNTNQSAEYIGMLNRNSSTDIDAAYYNPAGLTDLSDGWHISFSSQTAFQTDRIRSDLATLNTNEFKGKVRAWVFPDLHIAYIKEKTAYSFSLMPIGGGGGAEYNKGLPSFEYGFAGYVGSPVENYCVDHQYLGTITGYRDNAEFKGWLLYAAGQANVAYEFSEMISASVGGRYLRAYSAVEGSLTEVILHTSSGTDLSADSIAALADHRMKATRTGSGFTGIIGLNIKHMDMMNLAFRYEFKTRLRLKTHNDDPNAIHFADGEIGNFDMPAMYALGLSYKITPMIITHASFNYFRNSSVNWDEGEIDDGYEIGVGMEHHMDALSISAGYLYSKSGSTRDYRNDTRLDLDSDAFATGFAYKLSELIKINLGATANFYREEKKTLPALNNSLIPNETYNQDNIVLAIGFNYTL